MWGRKAWAIWAIGPLWAQLGSNPAPLSPVHPTTPEECNRLAEAWNRRTSSLLASRTTIYDVCPNGDGFVKCMSRNACRNCWPEETQCGPIFFQIDQQRASFLAHQCAMKEGSEAVAACKVKVRAYQKKLEEEEAEQRRQAEAKRAAARKQQAEAQRREQERFDAERRAEAARVSTAKRSSEPVRSGSTGGSSGSPGRTSTPAGTGSRANTSSASTSRGSSSSSVAGTTSVSSVGRSASTASVQRSASGGPSGQTSRGTDGDERGSIGQPETGSRNPGLADGGTGSRGAGGTSRGEGSRAADGAASRKGESTEEAGRTTQDRARDVREKIYDRRLDTASAERNAKLNALEQQAQRNQAEIAALDARRAAMQPAVEAARKREQQSLDQLVARVRTPSSPAAPSPAAASSSSNPVTSRYTFTRVKSELKEMGTEAGKAAAAAAPLAYAASQVVTQPDIRALAQGSAMVAKANSLVSSTSSIIERLRGDGTSHDRAFLAADVITTLRDWGDTVARSARRAGAKTLSAFELRGGHKVSHELTQETTGLLKGFGNDWSNAVDNAFDWERPAGSPSADDQLLNDMRARIRKTTVGKFLNLFSNDSPGW